MAGLAQQEGAPTFCFPGRQYRVNLVHEDDCRLEGVGHCKERTHHLFALANPFGRQGAGADVEEGGLDIAGNRSANQSLPRAGRPKKQQALGRCSCALLRPTQAHC